MRLDELPLRKAAHIDAIDWAALDPVDGKRLRELGFDEGVSIETLHSGSIFGRDPIACRVGRMTVAIRRAQARAIRLRARMILWLRPNSAAIPARQIIDSCSGV